MSKSVQLTMNGSTYITPSSPQDFFVIYALIREMLRLSYETIHFS